MPTAKRKLPWCWTSGQPFAPNANETYWLHPAIPRSKAIQLITDHGGDDGAFLIRKSLKRHNTHVVSLVCDKTFSHFEIEKRGIYYFLEEGPYLPSLEHLVDHYTRFADGLPIQLKHPVPPLPPPRTMPKPSNPALPPRVPPGRNPPSTVYPSNLKPIDTRKRYENNETLRRVRHSRDNIPLESVHLKEAIGEGEFGSVYKSVYMNENGHIRDVAVKVINAVEESSKQDFIREANVMMNLDHQCIVQFIGKPVTLTPTVL